MSLMIDSLKERLNVYGLGDVVVNEVSDRPGFIGGGSKFILVEIAGASEEEVRDLLGKQGKFEAKIGNGTVFKGGQDITYVCRTAQCSGIDPQRGCGRSSDGSWGCSFMFSISLSPEAAQRQADFTRDLSVSGGSLSEPLVLYLDDQEVDRLNIAADLRGRATTDIAISGGGKGATEQASMEDALKNMKRLQTILITGSLPVKLEIERIDGISATLGKEFLTNALYVWLLALVGVAVVLVIVYRKFIIAVPIIFTAISEIFLTLAIAALIGWNIDLAAIAGLILAVGEGTNDQVVITDEAIRKETDAAYNWKERIKRAFFIIFSAYMTMVVAMLPLLFAGAGLLKGFAITTILAVSVGIFVTRPAYAQIVQMLLED
jgi:preprotein translocase subunit SecD